MLMVATNPEFADPTSQKVVLAPLAQSHFPRQLLPRDDLTQSVERQLTRELHVPVSKLAFTNKYQFRCPVHQIIHLLCTDGASSSQKKGNQVSVDVSLLPDNWFFNAHGELSSDDSSRLRQTILMT